MFTETLVQRVYSNLLYLCLLAPHFWLQLVSTFIHTICMGWPACCKFLKTCPCCTQKLVHWTQNSRSTSSFMDCAVISFATDTHQSPFSCLSQHACRTLGLFFACVLVRDLATTQGNQWNKHECINYKMQHILYYMLKFNAMKQAWVYYWQGVAYIILHVKNIARPLVCAQTIVKRYNNSRHFLRHLDNSWSQMIRC